MLIFDDVVWALMLDWCTLMKMVS